MKVILKIIVGAVLVFGFFMISLMVLKPGFSSEYAYKKMFRLAEKHNYCTKDSDCTDITMNIKRCGERILVNKKEEKAAAKKVIAFNKFIKSTDTGCRSAQIFCVSGKCAANYK
ncbi:hypothetical protein Dip518_000910 [Parelusimicrobium proximum]|uniref:hypothetical protein n=1 Tax=Parelusimicrobium proximum TaxID=3228953 RepID=UPI003D17F161